MIGYESQEAFATQILAPVTESLPISASITDIITETVTEIGRTDIYITDSLNSDGEIVDTHVPPTTFTNNVTEIVMDVGKSGNYPIVDSNDIGDKRYNMFNKDTALSDNQKRLHTTVMYEISVTDVVTEILTMESLDNEDFSESVGKNDRTLTIFDTVPRTQPDTNIDIATKYDVTDTIVFDASKHPVTDLVTYWTTSPDSTEKFAVTDLEIYTELMTELISVHDTNLPNIVTNSVRVSENVATNEMNATDIMMVTGIVTEIGSTVVDTIYPDRVIISESASNTSSVTAKWTIIDGIADYFEVNCSDGRPEHQRMLFSDSFTATCSGIESGRTVNINVTAVSGKKRGETMTLAITTYPERVNLLESASNTSSISAEWTIIDGVADYFEVNCSDGRPAHQRTLFSDAITATCSGIESGRTVNISVTAMNGKKRGETMTLAITTYPERVILFETASNTSSVSAKWTIIDGVADYFEVNCSDGRPEHNRTLFNDAFTATCLGIESGRTVNINVTAVSGTKRGETMTLAITTYPERVILFETVSNTSSVSAEWTIIDGVADYFEVNCSDGRPAHQRTLFSDAFTATCSGIESGRTVNISVTAVRGRKRGETMTLAITTYPERVIIFETVSNTSSVSAEWTIIDGVADYFEVNCSDGRPAHQRTLFSDAFTATCSGIESGRTVNIGVTAMSGKKRGETLTLAITTYPERVIIFETVSNTSSVSAEWTIIDGVADYFEVNCSDGRPAHQRTLFSDAFTATCSGIESGRTVNISVTAMSGKKRGETMTLAITTYPERVILFETACNISSVTAKWTIMDGVADYFEVNCSDGRPAHQRTLFSDAFTATCSGIESGRTVNISVTAMSGKNRGETMTLAITTYPERVILFETVSNTSSVSAEWTIIDGVADYFEVNCSDGRPAHQRPLFSDSFTATCSGIESGRTVNISVTAVSGKKRGETMTLAITTYPERVILFETVSNTSSVSAEWTIVDGVADYFEVNCSDGRPVHQRTLFSDAFTATCSGIESGRTVNISVTAVRGRKRGETMTLAITTYPPEVILSEVTSNTSSVTANWTIMSGFVDYFDISCSSGIPEKSKTSFDGVHLVTCSNAEPGRNVEINVTAVCGTKRGKTDSITITAIPAEVSLHKFSSTINSVTASWSPPRGDAGYYTVICVEGGEVLLPNDGPIVAASGNILRASCIDLPVAGKFYTLGVYTHSNGLQSSMSTIRISTDRLSFLLIEGGSTTSTVSASWEPLGASTVDQYKISCSQGRASPSEVGSLDLPKASCIDLPTPGSMYSMTVTVIKDSLPLETSQPFFLTTLPDRVELRKVSSTQDSITCEWDLPAGEVDFFEVRCSDGKVENPKVFVNDDPFLRASCTDLTVEGKYTVYVISVSNGKRSTPASSITIETAISSSENSTTIAVVIGSIALILFLIAISFIAYEYKKKKSRERNSVEAARNMRSPVTNQLYAAASDALMLTEVHGYLESDDQLYLSVFQQVEYEIITDDVFEYPIEDIKFLEELGKGAFGKVFKAHAKNIAGKSSVTTVAVKMLQDGVGEDDKKDFDNELALMKKMAPHPNIIRLLGACTRIGTQIIIVEYAANGALLSYLRSSRTSDPVYCNIHKKSSRMSTPDLIQMALQVAKGMVYISSLNIIHRDLAARNILVNENLVCKISDFGLSRQACEFTDTYVKSAKRARLPVRWMAYEAIFEGIYTSKSDVWSYGVLLWEIVTQGDDPYAGKKAKDVLHSLKQGYRMQRPQHCSPELYDVMLQCWDQEPGRRPTFVNIFKQLDKLMTEDSDYLVLDTNEQAVYDDLNQASLDWEVN
ncbi:uncharacterized protein LOC117105051 isoform X2 [Anneissia japonica]|uniref:uncharacterized protein LOC117105051 isoform X2 n=1 Tax=Anneissia japonica TaxID=1529436 RepID=UPI001425A815|nr:uncharacterized protein LOC117105051 isoform X2 [Anneissia japonica]